MAEDPLRYSNMSLPKALCGKGAVSLDRFVNAHAEPTQACSAKGVSVGAEVPLPSKHDSNEATS